jgi:hypothetical protein
MPMTPAEPGFLLRDVELKGAWVEVLLASGADMTATDTGVGGG